MAFGLWLLSNPPADNPIDITKPDKYFAKVGDREKLMKPLTILSDFDVYYVLKGNMEM